MTREYLIDEIREVLDCPLYCGGSLREEAGPDRRFGGVSTDSRRLLPGELFIALRGERFDAHDFLDQVAGRAAAVVIDRPDALAGLPAKLPALLVPDTMTALDQIAAWYRRRLGALGARVIAVSGSVGKTTTREMVIAALGRKFKVHGTAQNLNNHIGLAQTLFAAPETAELLVLELGIDQPGDMDVLGAVANPDIAILTVLGLSHVAHFGDREGIAREKLRLLAHVRPGGAWILNADEPLFRQAAREAIGVRVTLVSDQDARPSDLPPTAELLVARDIETTATGTRFAVDLKTAPAPDADCLLPRVDLDVAGRHQVRNALFGLAAARLLGLAPAEAAAGLVDFVTTGDRLRLVEIAPLTVVSDAYNASLESIGAALDFVDTIAAGRRRVVAIGGIAELGDHSDEVHEAVGRRIARTAPDLVFLSGPDAGAMERGLRATPEGEAVCCRSFASREELEEALIAAVRPDDLILLKASRTYAFDRLLEPLTRRAEELRHA
ncbi:MAG: UDP-N-acetylmuramoyl-tripeptide--D-alanyl-D-alanine ligase [Bacillota bacterium]|nr:UDP-N-acetylmuramoyl-tripeptide--D-alanyl-D-alanine ligase [Bacillota bacterium]